MNQKINELLSTVLMEKNISFLIGAGASTPFFSSLGNLENVLTNSSINESGKQLIKALFYDTSIANNIYLVDYLQDCLVDDGKDEKIMYSILLQYKRFIHNILEYMKVRNSRVSPKRTNIITTNYDLFIEAAIDDILEDNPRVHFNDGTNGYTKKILQTDNFNKTLLYSGIFDNYSNEMPTINLIKCHGSVNWQTHYSRDNKKRIQVNSSPNTIHELNSLIDSLFDDIEVFITEEEDLKNWFTSIDDLVELINEESSEYIKDDINLIGDHFSNELSEIENKLAEMQIVYPTKKKFESTLVNEYYFSLLRLLSYELEKEQTTLIVFGFSFYDEHITEIVQRSLNNPNLLVIIFCFADKNKNEIISNFNFTPNTIPNNIKFVLPSDFILKEIDIETYKQESGDEDLAANNIIVDEEQITIYSKEVSFIKKEDGSTMATLNFSSLNQLLEADITNTFNEKHFSVLADEGDDFLE
ncbi:MULTISPECIES: SIR2 family protein [unclassified Enterococcus]|uniref:SIR2 family protein n=1 Tax=unclassified Enterococcus TaxID=2608891 RepID=UPI00259BC256|nr:MULTISPECIES: SIR2 family protein [unclassified Enterococcus]MDO0919920.1 SIR2 family protein [Enterococcus sp. B1E2]WIV15392.1 SIR2 family protein [Enterococcus sp. FZMF]